MDHCETAETVLTYANIGFSCPGHLTSSHHLGDTETFLKRLPIGFRMPRPLQFNETAPFAVRDGALRLGERLALARKRRRLTLRELAAKAGISYDTARAAEAGNLQTGLGAYLAMLWAMGLESEINSFLDPDRDETGKQLEIARQPRRVAHRRTRHDDDF
jgi:transcriptional regulator with XRE-family HTH domain